MLVLLLVLPPLVAALLTFALTPTAIAIATRVGAVDQPSPRKVHKVPVPRLGGLAVIVASMLTIVVAKQFDFPVGKPLRGDFFWTGVALGLLPVILISIWDDIRPLRGIPKLMAHSAGALIAVYFGIRLNPEIHLFGNEYVIGWMAIPVSVLWIAGVTNAFNIVDGLDGLSAGLALISAISLAAVAVVAKRYEMALAALTIAGSLAGFLPFNFFPARVFLGDTGATAVGFTLACLALRGGATLSAGMAILVPVLVMSLPIAETLVSMLRRMIRKRIGGGGGIFEADREHFHHRLLSRGFDQRQTVFVLYGIGVAVAVCGVISLFVTHQTAALLLLTLLIAAFVGLQKLGYDEFAFVRRGSVLRAYQAPVLRSTLFIVFFDITMILIALYAAIVLKYDDWLLTRNLGLAHALVALLPPVFLATLLTFGVYRGSWRMASVEDLLRPTAAILTGGFAGFMLSGLVRQNRPPATLFVIMVLILLGLINGSRASYRILLSWNRRAAANGEPAIIYGAGARGTMALREALLNPSVQLKPVGFIDDDLRLKGRTVNGLPVLGSLDEIRLLLNNRVASCVVVASDRVSDTKLLHLHDTCDAAGAKVRYFHMTFDPLGGRPTTDVASAYVGSPAAGQSAKHDNPLRTAEI